MPITPTVRRTALFAGAFALLLGGAAVPAFVMGGARTPAAGPCIQDARALCPELFSSSADPRAFKRNLVACLRDNYDALSPECQDEQDTHDDLNAAVRSACAGYFGYCADIEPVLGSEPCFEEMRTHYADLPDACVDALEAQYAASSPRG